MNGVSRFLGRRDRHQDKRAAKNASHRSRPSQVSSDLYKLFTSEGHKTTADKEMEKKVKMLLSRLQCAGISRMGDEQALHALSWYPDNLDKAYNLLLLANESIEGELKDYNPDTPMLGAVNRNMVTCYLDALLFAMFARLDSFEAMLYDNFEDEPRKQLAAVLRLWVNLLRTGQLIKVELTKHLQDSLAACGWEEAAHVRQQDASEAFTFITGALELPLLTLKMDIYHTGREDKEDDHKFVNERLLEVAIPEQQEGGHVICLEDCLETYFNNRIEVKRFLQRQNTMASIRSREEDFFGKDPEKYEAMHVETIELSESTASLVSMPISFDPSASFTSVRPVIEGRRRANSIFRERVAQKPPEASNFDEKRHLDDMLDHSSGGRPRSASLLRKEILMPAWQFFSLIPWYTDNVPQTDAQVAAHFSVKRPVLGICLKRYTMLPNGAPKRLNTYIDIPLEIGLPHFISDDRMKEEGPLFGNFKLVLQSVVCHRGVSVDSGHYIALVRADCNEKSGALQVDEEEASAAWLRFDDLSSQRVTQVKIEQALRDESPYLLFYQVQPIDEELASRGDPPPYKEAQSGTSSLDPSTEVLESVPYISTPDSTSASATACTAGPETALDADESAQTGLDGKLGHSEEALTRHSISSNCPSSIGTEETEETVSSPPRGRTQPPTPEDQKTGFLSASRRGSRAWTAGGSKSRPSSPSNESRLSLTLSRLTGRASRDKLHSKDTAVEDPVVILEKMKTPDNGLAAHPAGSEKKDAGIARSKSKKEKKDKHRRSKSSDLGFGTDKGKHKDRARPERECAVM